jgi:hypothetical protein
MQTLDKCNQTGVTIDSVAITKTIAGGLVDPDFPNTTISTYPNPVNDHVNVTGLSAAKSYTIQIYDNQGAQVSQTTVAGETGVNVNFFSQQTGVYMLQVYDMIGRLVITDEAQKSVDLYEKSFNVSGLATGIYTIQVNIANMKFMVTKFFKK